MVVLELFQGFFGPIRSGKGVMSASSHVTLVALRGRFNASMFFVQTSWLVRSCGAVGVIRAGDGMRPVARMRLRSCAASRSGACRAEPQTRRTTATVTHRMITDDGDLRGSIGWKPMREVRLTVGRNTQRKLAGVLVVQLNGIRCWRIGMTGNGQKFPG